MKVFGFKLFKAFISHYFTSPGAYLAIRFDLHLGFWNVNSLSRHLDSDFHSFRQEKVLKLKGLKHHRIDIEEKTAEPSLVPVGLCLQHCKV